MVAEEFLHFVWQLRLFNQLNLFSQAGEVIRIIHPGRHNKDAGPDFLHAVLSINGWEWHGHVEMHVDGADWSRHQHQNDPAYTNVVLHVVMHNPVPACRADGTFIPTFVLADHIDPQLIYRYTAMMKSLSWIPCEAQLPTVEPIHKYQALDGALVERLAQKTLFIQGLLEETQGDWERTLFLLLCRAFGMKVNADVFLDFAKRLDFDLLRKYHHDRLKLEALCYGQAGMLTGTGRDPYRLSLQQEYHYLQQLHHLKPQMGLNWRSLRMRPFNFPAFRMAQLMGLYGLHPYFFQEVLDTKELTELTGSLAGLRASAYWENHFSFRKVTPQHATGLTKSFVQHLTINVFVPLVYAYGKVVVADDLQQRALDWLMAIPAEDNKITRKFVAMGMPMEKAADSQAVLHLHEHYCSAKRCLSCAIGNALLKP